MSKFTFWTKLKLKPSFFAHISKYQTERFSEMEVVYVYRRKSFYFFSLFYSKALKLFWVKVGQWGNFQTLVLKSAFMSSLVSPEKHWLEVFLRLLHIIFTFFIEKYLLTLQYWPRICNCSVILKYNSKNRNSKSQWDFLLWNPC